MARKTLQTLKFITEDLLWLVIPAVFIGGPMVLCMMALEKAAVIAGQ